MKYDMKDYRTMVRVKTKGKEDQLRYIDDYLAEFQETPIEIPELPVNQAQWYSGTYIGFKRIIRKIREYVR